uniref:Si:ch73-233m11.2 n=1 Tax=Neogobius melanostomus TaxID=47308 RepID=A0A8C6U269_9GOBI
MPGASFIIASQTSPNLEFLSGVQLEVLGFLKPQRDAFFSNFFPDPVTAKNALLHFETTLGFYDFSKSPQFCYTVCSAYNFLINSGTKLPMTLTQLFVHILVYLIDKITQKDKMINIVRALGNLASHCALNSQSNVQRDTLDEFGLLSEFPLSDFLCVYGESDKAIYSWRSPLMQEFILAVSVLLGLSLHSVEEILEKHKKHTHFLDIFMSGLCEQVHWRPLEETLGPCSANKIFAFKNWLKTLCEKTLPGNNKEDHCRCFHLLYQMQNEKVVKEVITPSARLGLSYGNLKLLDYVVLNYVVRQLGEMEQINLYNTSLLTEEMAEILAPTMAVSCKFILSQCSFEDGAVTHVASALSKGIATSLDLSYSCLNKKQLQSLCTGLKNCKVESLQFSRGKLTEASCEEFVPALTSTTSQLSVLNLCANQIGDMGLKKLCEALQNPHNKVQGLNLQHCTLTAASMEDLSTALSSGHSKLININLSNNEIGDTGVKPLSKGVQHPFCKLESLRLFDCYLTEACCPLLAEALMSKHCSLREIDLSVNELGHEGAMVLCKALKRPGCPMEKLSLARCELTEAVFVELASLLKSGSPPLKSLSVACNDVGDQGVHHLWEAIRHPSCELEKLDVEMTGLTDACVNDMCAAIKASKTMRKLKIHNNLLTDVSVPTLIRVMQESPNMEKLNVQYNDFGEEMFELFETCPKIRY